MPLEIERKFRVESHEAIRTRLKSLGGFFAGVFLESNALLDTSEHRLRNTGCGVRIRTWHPQGVNKAVAPHSEITFKGPLQSGSARVREELQVSVGDPVLMESILLELGYQPQLRYVKRRERWTVDGVHVELDTLPLLGCFVEVESDSRDAVDAWVRKLGLAAPDEESSTYVALLLSMCGSRGIDPLHLHIPPSSPLGVV